MQFSDTRSVIDLNTYQPSKKVATYLAFVNNVRNYVTDDDAYREIIHPEAVFTEYPNLVTKNGQVRTAGKGMKGIETGKQILAEQKYEFFDFAEAEDKVVTEGVWTGTMKVDAGHLKQGQQLKAYLCIVIEFKDDKIYRVRNYDCYEPFTA
jgi:ketosteroid isomerase-like protein